MCVQEHQGGHDVVVMELAWGYTITGYTIETKVIDSQSSRQFLVIKYGFR